MNTPTLAIEAPFFEPLKNVLYLLDHPVRIQALSEKIQVPALILGPYPYLSPDPERAEESLSTALSLAFVNDVLQATRQKEDPFADSLHFEIICPFQIKADTYNDLAQLVIRLNQIIPVGYFHLPLQGSPSLVYSWKTNTRDLNTVLCVEIINTLLFFFEPLANKLEGLNAGIIDLEEALVLAGEALENPDRDIQNLLEAAQTLLRESEIEL